MKQIPIWEKSNLTLEEAAAYSGIGINKLRQLTDDDNCEFVLWIGTKRLIMILSRLVDTFISRISLTMLPVPKPQNTACVLSWEEARRWQSRSSGYSSS